MWKWGKAGSRGWRKSRETHLLATNNVQHTLPLQSCKLRCCSWPFTLLASLFLLPLWEKLWENSAASLAVAAAKLILHVATFDVGSGDGGGGGDVSLPQTHYNDCANAAQYTPPVPPSQAASIVAIKLCCLYCCCYCHCLCCCCCCMQRVDNKWH